MSAIEELIELTQPRHAARRALRIGELLMQPGRTREDTDHDLFLTQACPARPARPREGEPVVNKTTVDPFLTTNLQSLLHNLDVNTLVLMGLWTNYVVEATARHAADMSYRVIVVREACASNSDENHNFAMDRILPTLATVTSVDEVVQALG